MGICVGVVKLQYFGNLKKIRSGQEFCHPERHYFVFLNLYVSMIILMIIQGPRIVDDYASWSDLLYTVQ